MEDYEKLKAKGVEVIACISVNDAFVMAAWGEASGAAGKIRMLADTSGAFTKVREALEACACVLTLGIVMSVSCSGAGCGYGTRCREGFWQCPFQKVLQYMCTVAMYSCSPPPAPRYSMIVENSVVKSLQVEPDGVGLTCSLSNSLLEQL